MSSKQSTAEFLAEQLRSAGDISYRKMFGEYALYCNSKVVAFICDDQLYVKPTDAGREFIGTPNEAPPYPGAKNYFLISEDKWDDTEWLSQLVEKTATSLPLPKIKK